MLKTITDTLRPVGGVDLVHWFSGGCFGYLPGLKEGLTSGKTVFSLLTYQIKPPNSIDTEFWFGIGG